MASDQGFVDYVVDQIDDDCAVTSRKMFGEYGLFSHGKIVALICDDRLFVKPTEGGRAYIGDVVEAPAYPGAKPSLLVEGGLEDGAWLSELVRITARELPAKKPKKGKKKASSRSAGGGDRRG
jgi:TfoX/Sxy family transcriptional regulator of competence genes